MKKMRISLLILLTAAIFTLPAATLADDYKVTEPATLTWVAGGVGGGWYVQAGGIAGMVTEKNPNIILKVVPGGGLVNPVRVGNGKDDIGWGITFVDKMALKGIAPLFKKPNENIRALGGIFGTYYVHILASEDKGIKTLAEMAEMIKAGKALKVAMPMKGTSDLPLIEKILQFYGTSKDDITNAGGKVFQANYADMTSLYKDRHVDFVLTHLALPGSAITEMMISRKSTILSISDECINTLSEDMGTLDASSAKHIIPKETYKGQQTDIATVVSTGELLVGSHVADNVAYDITKILCLNIDELHKINNSNQTFIPSEGWKNVSVPLHPGAEKFYREAGYMK